MADTLICLWPEAKSESQKRHVPDSLNIGELFPLLLLYIDQSIFSNCFLLDANNSGCAKKLTGGRQGWVAGETPK